MITYSVGLSDVDAAALESLAARHPGVAVHMIHLVALRIGAAVAEQDNQRVTAELGKVVEERRERRRVRLEKDASNETGRECEEVGVK